MKTDPINLSFSNTFLGEMQTPLATVKIGSEAHHVAPYHMFYGALGSCFYATFLSVSQKMRLQFDHATIEITGEKRDEVPATLSEVFMSFKIFGPKSDLDKLRKAAELGAKYCSIHETISKVATIHLDVTFE